MAEKSEINKMTRNDILKTAKPILFNTEMVKTVLDGRKTVTRRVIKSPAEVHECSEGIFVTRPRNYPDEYCRFEPYCPIKIGDILYVRETWGYGYEDGTYIYKASDKLANLPMFKNSTKLIYRPSIHMPKEAARIFLRVTNVSVAKLQDIDDEQALDEGYKGIFANVDWVVTPKEEYADTWNSTIKKSDLDKYGWNANPWVWVIKFERVEAQK